MPYVARRAQSDDAGVYTMLNGWIQEKRARGEDVINLGIGNPNRMPASPVLSELVESCRRDDSYIYPFLLPELHTAIADWYGERFGVALDPEREILPVWGTQEGLSHLPLAVMEHGDVCLLPDPGYPIYHYLPKIVDGEGLHFPLVEENSFLPRFDDIPAEAARRARFLLLNFPNNPLGVVAPMHVLEEAVAFCREHDILLVYDNAYSELTFDGRRAPSVLQVPGAKETAVEFNSFSKTFNMAGLRIGYVVGNAEVVAALGRIKGNIDYGLFRPAQRAAVCALRHPDRDAIVASVRAMYQERRDAFLEAARREAWHPTPPEGSMFVWTRVPRCDDDVAFAAFCIREAGVVVTPGSAYGPSGRGYVRIALVEEVPYLVEAATRIGRALASWDHER